MWLLSLSLPLHFLLSSGSAASTQQAWRDLFSLGLFFNSLALIIGSDEGLEGFFRVGEGRTGLFMLALVSRVRNCPEGVHSSARARLKVCEPSGQSPQPQWPYTGPVAEVRQAGRPDPALPKSHPSRSWRPNMQRLHHTCSNPAWVCVSGAAPAESGRVNRSR